MTDNTNETAVYAVLPRLTLRQRRAVEAVANGRRVSTPLSHGEILDMMERLATDVYKRDRLARYGDLLDALATLGAGASAVTPQAVEEHLQGVTPAIARYAVCACHGVERVPGDARGVWASLPLATLRRHTISTREALQPVSLCRHTGYASLHMETSFTGYLDAAGMETLWRLFFAVPCASSVAESQFVVTEDYARYECLPVHLGRRIAAHVYRIASEHVIRDHAAIPQEGERAAIWDRLREEYDAAPWGYPYLSASEGEALI